MWERGHFSLYLLLPLINLLIKGFPGGSVVKDLPANTGAIGDTGSIPGSGSRVQSMGLQRIGHN